MARDRHGGHVTDRRRGVERISVGAFTTRERGVGSDELYNKPGFHLVPARC